MSWRIGFVLACASALIVCNLNGASAAVIAQWNFATATAAPFNSPTPEVGSGAATVLGMDNNYIFSSGNTVPALQLYRQSFRPSQWLREPYAMVAVSVICAETDERAQWLAGPSRLSFLRLRQGRQQRLATPEEAAAYPYTDAEREAAEQRLVGQALGSPATVHSQLSELVSQTGADELMLTTMVYDIADRVRSFELVMRQAGPPPVPDP